MSHYEEVNVRGYDEFCRAVSERKGKDIFAYFSGDKDEQGKSWCPDCVKAEPVVRGVLSHLPEGSVFIYCQVGERAYRGWTVLKALVKSKNINCYSHVRGVGVAIRPLQHVDEGVFHSYAWLVRKPKRWKDPNNDFKKTLKLTGVPTLLRYGTPQKLVEDECFKADLVKMMFTED